MAEVSNILAIFGPLPPPSAKCGILQAKLTVASTFRNPPSPFFADVKCEPSPILRLYLLLYNFRKVLSKKGYNFYKILSNWKKSIQKAPRFV